MRATLRDAPCWRGIFLWILLFAACFAAQAREDRLRSDFLQHSWQTDQGLPHDSVTAIIQTSDSYLWVGTRRGLTRFDGMTFSLPDEFAVLANEYIAALCEDRQQNLWIATERGLFEWTGGLLKHFTKTNGLSSDALITICEARDGSLWIGTASGVTQFRNGKFHNFTTSDGLPHNVVRSLCEDESETLWIATDHGVCTLKQGVLSPVAMNPEWTEKVRAIAIDREKNIWVGTQVGLCRKTETGWDYFTKERASLSDDFVNVMYSDRSKRLWIGTYSGLNILSEGQFHTELTGEGAAYDLVNAICEDREGNVWIGSKEGLTRLRKRPFTAVTKQQGLTYNNVMSVLQDRTGTMWCATWGAGVFGFTQDRGVITAVTNWLPNYRVLSLCESHDGSLWFGTEHGAGLFHLKDGDLTRFDESYGLERLGIPVLYEDGATNLWVGTSRSLALRTGDRFVRFTSKDGLAGDAIKAICEDKEGNLWIGMSDGLSLRKKGATNFITIDVAGHDPVLAVHADREGDLWFSTAGGGLHRFRNKKLSTYTSQNGLVSADIVDIIEDDTGCLWMACLKGVFRIRKKSFDSFDRGETTTIPCASYGKEDGMTSIICCNVAKPVAAWARDGRLWFATTKGVNIADPKQQPNDLPPPVRIESVRSDKANIASDARALTVKPGRGELEIHYTALSFSAPEKNRFKYKLDGFDSDWIDVGTRRFAYYNNLPPGTYRFHVMACNNDRVWNSMTTPLELTLLPHWWQTWSFKLLVITSSLTIAVLAGRYLTRRRLQIRLELLEHQHAVEKERSRIARDMHDDLGACLTQILFLSDVARKNKSAPAVIDDQITRISQTTHEVIRNLDAIVWAVNPDNDDLDHFAAYIEEYAGMFLQSSGVHCRLDFPEKVPSIKLSSDVRHHLFLAVKEALNNALKYANATEIQVRLQLANNLLTLDVEDNGKGFARSEVSDFGNGLRNMENRLKTIGGCLDVQSKPNAGTRIHMQVALR